MKAKTQVYLVGAGPGDPLLLTQRAVMALQLADVVLYDFLIPQSCLRYALGAELVCVGKKKGLHVKTQDDIHLLMASYVADSKVVVRLKGGDPALFGRLGEEMAFLSQKGIVFDVIPGVSSATSVPLTLGVSLTHRYDSRSVAFMTGALVKGVSLSSLRFPQAETLVVFMPTFQLNVFIEELLLQTSFDDDTPVAFIHHGLTVFQDYFISTLGNLVSDKKKQGLDHPALLVIGKVSLLAEQMKDHLLRYLAGKRFWFTRVSARIDELHDQLAFFGADVGVLPLLELKSDEEQMKCFSVSFLKAFAYIIFTSQYAVELFFQRCFDLGLDARFFSQHQIVSIGAKTTEALKRFSFIPDLEANKASQLGVLDIMPENLKSISILYPASSHAKNTLLSGLQDRGASVTYIPFYQPCTLRVQQALLPEDYVFFLSGSAVHAFYQSYSRDTAYRAICIGSQTAAVLHEYKEDFVFVCDSFDLDAVMALF